jgi:hypothetical protein
MALLIDAPLVLSVALSAIWIFNVKTLRIMALAQWDVR